MNIWYLTVIIKTFLYFLLLEIYLHLEINIVSAKIYPACGIWCVCVCVYIYI
jgi:hypothetical protein